MLTKSDFRVPRYATVDLRGRTVDETVSRGKHLLLIGEPGSGKTDVARALPGELGRELYHMEVSGLSDVSQLEAERYLEVKDGASVTVSKQTALIDALEAAEDLLQCRR